MKLRYSATSPFVRKVLMVAHEAGLADRIERVPTDAWAADTTIQEDNPLSKVPALRLDDGTVLLDSPVICEYLDHLNQGRKLLPEPGPARWADLRLQALADGMCDAGVLRLLESRRPEALRSQAWMERQRLAVTRTLDHLEHASLPPPEAPTVGSLALVAALGWLSFRFPAEPFAPTHPHLSTWYTQASSRPSADATKPPAG